MANLDNPHGFRPLGFNLAGGCFLAGSFQKVDTYATAIFVGDVLKQLETGYINAWASGVAPSGVSLAYSAASTADTVLAVIDPTAVFEGQGDSGGSATLDFADCGLNATIATDEAGDVATKQSGMEIDASSKNTGNTLELHLIDKLNVPDNAYGAFARFMVTFNVHRMLGGTAGV
jgi:hypothetical protein